MIDLPIDLVRMEQMISRLRSEMDQAENAWFTEGSRAAREWVEHEAPYALLRQLGEASMEQRLELLHKSPPHPLAERLQQNRKQEGFLEMNYLKGWAHMTGLLWDVVKRSL